MGMVPKFPVKLAMPDVDGVNLCGATLQQAIRKTASGCADIQRNPSLHVDVEMIESAFELQRAPPDIFLRRPHCDRCLWSEKLRWFCRDPSADLNLASHHRALRLLAAGE